MAGSEAGKAVPTRTRLPKTLAGIFLTLGAMGVAFSAASQVNAGWEAMFQAGAAPHEGTCQDVNHPVTVQFADPALNPASDITWVVEQVEFSGISPNCVGSAYEVAYREANTWVALPTEDSRGIVEGSVITVDLGGVNLDATSEFAISFSSSPSATTRLP